MKRRPRKIIARVVVFLLLGAIVNVAVAWGCLANLGGRLDFPDTTLTDQYAADFWRTHVPSDWPELQFVHNGWAVGATVQSLGAIDSPTELVADHRDFNLIIRTVGLPVRALSGGSYISRGALKKWSTGSFDSFSTDTEVVLRGVNFGSVFPARPVWPGFAINTVFYAAVLWMVFALPFALRRRRRIKRGLCPACAYPIGSSPVCTECGAAVTTIRGPAR